MAKKTVQLNDMKNEGICGCFKTWCTSKGIANQQTLFETNCMIIEKEFKKLDRVAAYNERVEPCLYVLMLLGGICAAILSVLMIVHVLLSMVVIKGKIPSNPFLNSLLGLI